MSVSRPKKRLRGVAALMIMIMILVLAAARGEAGKPAGLRAADSAGQDVRSMTFPPVEFKPPKAERIQLSNGLVLYLLQDHELPIIRISVMIRTGAIYESSDRVGLAGLTGTVLRTGGTRRWSGDEIDEELEFLAASIETGIGNDAGYASLDVLKKDFDRGLELFHEILRYPVMDEQKLDLAKKAVIEGILRRNDSPSNIARREFNKLLYGEGHPFVREPTIVGISSIEREDLLAFHRDYFHPNSMIMGITGDFDRKSMIRRIKKSFGKWKRGQVRLPSVPSVEDNVAGSVNYIERDLTQAYLRIGHLSIRRDNPDFFALSVLDDILGGRPFTSRLFQEIRTRRGLAYSVGTSLNPGNIDRGYFVAYAQTRADAAHQAITAITDEIRKIQREPVTEEELERAKESFLNGFVFSFTSPAQIVNRQMRLEYYGLPADFLERFRDNVAGVTRQDIQRVARQYLRPDGLVILAVGIQERFDRPLSALGQVNTIVLEEERLDPEKIEQKPAASTGQSGSAP